MNNEEIVYLIKKCNHSGDNILHYCIKEGHASKLVKLMQSIKDFLVTNNLSNVFYELFVQLNAGNHTFLNLTVFNNSLEFHQTLWTYLNQNMLSDDVYNICFQVIDENGVNFAHFLVQMIENPFVIECIFKNLKAILPKDLFLQGIKLKGHLGRNLFQTAMTSSNESENYKIMWKILYDTHNSKFSNILFELDSNGNSIINMVVNYSTGEIFNDLINFIKIVLPQSKIKELFLTI